MFILSNILPNLKADPQIVKSSLILFGVRYNWPKGMVCQFQVLSVFFLFSDSDNWCSWCIDQRSMQLYLACQLCQHNYLAKPPLG